MSDYLVTAENFHDLFTRNVSFLDVRAEDEFAKGSLPNAINLPILNNRERHRVGTCYKQAGQQAAVKLGHELVSGELKAARIQGWCDAAARMPDMHLYCWRGGMRSNLTRQWMSEVGVDVPLIEGGYKALRRFLMQVIEDAASDAALVRIGGKTGVAKTLLIQQIACGIDLEKYANHRGSSFGRMVDLQPTQSNFEHLLAVDLLQTIRHTTYRKALFVEDESRNIGAIAIPVKFFEAMRRAPLVLVEMPLEFRIERVMQEYVIDMLSAFQSKDPGNGFEHFSHYLKESLLRIQRRLGLERYQSIYGILTNALQTHLRTGDVYEHVTWIAALLTGYYDPMYEYQIGKNKEAVIFSGNYAEVLDWTKQYSNA